MMSCGCRFDEDEHYADLPDENVTEIGGIPVTTALRTVIDIALDMEGDEFEGIVDDCLARRLFTIEEAGVRLAEDDMRTRPGAIRLRALMAEKSRPDPDGDRSSGSRP